MDKMSASALPKSSETLMPTESYANHLVTFNATYLSDIPTALASWQCKRVVLVASRALTQSTSIISSLEAVLGSKIVARQIGVRSHTPYEDVIAITKLLHNHHANSIVCIGSSSYSDACKAARLLHNTLTVDQFTEERMEQLIDPDHGATFPGILKPPSLKLICVPCSLSASEYSPVASATNATGKKQHFGELARTEGAPDLVLLDPEVAVTVPATLLWLPSGARAIDHCVESLCSRYLSQEGQVIAARGLRALTKGLQTYARLQGCSGPAEATEFLQSIADCQRGARDGISGIIVHGSFMGPSHAIGHQLGSLGNITHGLTSSICLAPTLKFESMHPQSPHWDVAKQSEVLSIFNEAVFSSEREAHVAVEQFYRSLGLPTRLSDVGVLDDQMLKQIAQHTLKDIWGGGPKQIDSVEDVLEILHMAR